MSCTRVLPLICHLWLGYMGLVPWYRVSFRRPFLTGSTPLGRGLYPSSHLARNRPIEVGASQRSSAVQHPSPQPCLSLSGGMAPRRARRPRECHLSLVLPKLITAPPSTSRPLVLEWSHLEEANRYKVSPKTLWEILLPSTQPTNMY